MSPGADTERRTPVKKRDWIAERLARAEMVEWDRFVVGEREGYQCVTVYGWIEREDDDYKDFALAEFWPANEAIGYTTSSDKYTHELGNALFKTEGDHPHNQCRRVEHTFDIENAIELTTETALDEFANEQEVTAGE